VLLPGQNEGTVRLLVMTLFGATRDEVLFVAFLIAMTLLGTYVGDIGEAFARLLQRRR
jgi:hypothetical protein